MPAPTRPPSQNTALALGNGTDLTDSHPSQPQLPQPPTPEPRRVPRGCLQHCARPALRWTRRVTGRCWRAAWRGEAEVRRGAVGSGAQPPRESPAGRGGCPTAAGCCQCPAAPAAPRAAQTRGEGEGERGGFHGQGKTKQEKRIAWGCWAGWGCWGASQGPPRRRTLLCEGFGGSSAARDRAWAQQPSPTPCPKPPALSPLLPGYCPPPAPHSPAWQSRELRPFLPSVFINRDIPGRSLRQLLSHQFSLLEYSLTAFCCFIHARRLRGAGEPRETGQLQGWTQRAAPSGVFISLIALPLPVKPRAGRRRSRAEEILAGLGYAGAKREGKRSRIIKQLSGVLGPVTGRGGVLGGGTPTLCLRDSRRPPSSPGPRRAPATLRERQTHRLWTLLFAPRSLEEAHEGGRRGGRRHEAQAFRVQTAMVGGLSTAAAIPLQDEGCSRGSCTVRLSSAAPWKESIMVKLSSVC